MTLATVVPKGAAQQAPEGAAVGARDAAQAAVPAPGTGEGINGGFRDRSVSSSWVLTQAEVESALAEVDASTTIDDAAKEAIRATYKRALQALEEAAEFTARARQYGEAVQSASIEAEAARQQLQALPPPDEADAPSLPDSTEELQQELARRQAANSTLGDELARVTDELARIKARPVEISARLPEVQRQLASTREQLAAFADTAEGTSPSRKAERFVVQATYAKLLAELEMLKQEQLSQLQREELLTAQQQLFQRQAANASAAFDALEALLENKLTTKVRRAHSRAAEVLAELPAEHDKAQRLGRGVQSLAQEFETVVAEVQRVRAVQAQLASEKEALLGRYTILQEQLELGGGGAGMAQSLIDLQRHLLSSYGSIASAELPQLDQPRLALLRMEESLREQEALERDLLADATPPMARLVALRRELLLDVRAQYEVLVRGLAEYLSDKRQFADRIDSISVEIRDQLFWMRTCPPMSIETFANLPGGLVWVASAERGRALGRALLFTLRERPLASALFLLPAFGLLLMRGAILGALRRAAERVRRISSDQYTHTLAALVWTVMLALPVPLLLWFTEFALRNSPLPTQWTWDLAGGLRLGAWLTVSGMLLAAVCRPAGLAEAHFGWRNAPLRRIRRSILLYMAISVPMLVLAASTFHEDQVYYFNSVGRMALITSGLWAVFLAWRLLYRPGGIIEILRRDHPGQLMTKWRYAWSGLIIAVLLFAVILVMLGYVMTAIALNRGLLVTIGIVAGGQILFQVLMRWFRVKQRKLALAEAIERRRAREAATNEHEQIAASEVVNVDPEEEATRSLAEITGDTKRLLGLLFRLGIIVATVLYWSEMFPIWDYLDRVPALPAAALSWQGLIELVLIVIITVIVVRDAPGVLELGVLRATRIDPGTCHAITTLCQYGVTAIGLALFFNVLKVDWAQFGWIAAALSVGLGFGLQEVVGNFVCGLILLFERPLRVGDIVTVEGVTGSVSKIHLRATTIVNWDRQEFVVPNKTLITSTLLNWTLSAPINRIVVPIGVAYGSDTSRARDILLDVAKEHPLVLDDPVPMATFEQFADSSLTLYLRAYLPDMDNRLAVITDLHTMIAHRFKEAGIEIAFPQQDLHLRSGWEKLHQPRKDSP